MPRASLARRGFVMSWDVPGPLNLPPCHTCLMPSMLSCSVPWTCLPQNALQPWLARPAPSTNVCDGSSFALVWICSELPLGERHREFLICDGLYWKPATSVTRQLVTLMETKTPLFVSLKNDGNRCAPDFFLEKALRNPPDGSLKSDHPTVCLFNQQT